MELPNLEGQPGWVVVLVMALVVFGGLGTAYLAKRRPKEVTTQPADEDKQATLSTRNGGDASTMAVVQAAIDHLAETARAATAGEDKAEREAEQLRIELQRKADELNECQRNLADCKRELADCERDARQLAMRAWREGPDGA